MGVTVSVRTWEWVSDRERICYRWCVRGVCVSVIGHRKCVTGRGGRGGRHVPLHEWTRWRVGPCSNSLDHTNPHKNTRKNPPEAHWIPDIHERFVERCG